MKIPYLAILIFFSVSGFSQNFKNEEIYIKNKCEKGKQIYYLDDLFFGHPILLDKLNLYTLKINHPIYLFCTDVNQHFVKAFPSDTILLFEKDKKLFFESTKKRELNFFYNKLFTEVGPLRIPSTSDIKNISFTLLSRDSFFNTLYKRRLDFLNKEKLMLNDNDYREAFSIIKSVLILEKIKIPSKFLIWNDILNYYKDSISTFELQLESLQKYPLNPIIKETALKLIDSKILLNSKDIDIFKLISTSYSQKLKDFLIARKFKEQVIKFSNNKFSDSLFDRYISTISDTTLFKEVSDFYNFEKEKRNLLFTDKDIMNRENQYTSLKEIIKNNSGKTLFIDLWASWCMPCISEFSYSERLIKKYTNVKFIFLSLDKNLNDWKSIHSKYSILSNSNSFLLLNDFNSKFAKSIKLSDIPRYLIIDKNGNVKNFYAPRPSEKRISKILESL